MVKRETKRKPSSLGFVPSGCTTLDLALGGGWAERRVSNIIGDRSTGKTLVVLEAAANFVMKHPKGGVWYRESEHAFDADYAKSLGMPLDRVELVQLDTVEAMFDDLGAAVSKAPKPLLYILDSLDALSDVHEQARGFRDKTYGTDKAAALSEMFRRRIGELATAEITMLIVSQIRSNISSMPFAKKWVRAGGRALDFYASQVVFLSQTGTVTRELQGIKRTTGITVRAKVEKNKVGKPFRDAEFEITFGYGIDDLKAMVAFLDKAKALDGDKPAALLKSLRSDEFPELRDNVRKRVTRRWHEIETSFMPAAGKYT